ncbi:MAG: outer membrane lipoprotein-sorting protein [Nevskiales bacterium]|nr:outer membrane lipoprotein-sorting protein [Nevskiales bacterium]
MRWRRALLMVACGFAAGTAWADDAARDHVVGCMRANIPQSVQVKEVELTATDRTGGKRVLRGRLYGTRVDERLRAMIKIESPSDLAGAAYLMRENGGGDDMYVYVPALRKVRRITGSAADNSLWGTDISYGDVKQINNAFSAGQVDLLGESELSGHKVHMLALHPAPETDSRFGLIRLWVDQASCVTIQAEFVEGQTVRKRLVVAPDGLRQTGEHWYAADAQMSDLQEGTSTRLKVLGVSSDLNLSGRYFNPSTFYIGN